MTASAVPGQLFSSVFADFIASIADEPHRDMLRATAFMLNEGVEAGHTRVVLEQHADTDTFPPATDWADQLRQSGLVSDGSSPAPFVLQESDGQHYLALYRHYIAEQQLASKILSHASSSFKTPLPSGLAQCFHGCTDQINWQAIAAACALKNKLCIITGGPGTGKTTTVAKIISLLKGANPDHTIALAAPTGKAARRLADSLQNQQIEHPAITLHRLLGIHTTGISHNAHNPLPMDTVIVDEASMIDLELMGRLFDALRPQTRLILLGDENQLASVEAGSVLYDMCKCGSGFSKEFCDEISAAGIQPPSASAQTSPLCGCIVKLTHSWRFDQHKGIGRLAEAVLQGEINKEIFDTSEEVEFIPFAESVMIDWLEGQIRDIKQAQDIQHVWQIINRRRILCATRSGPRGLSTIDRHAKHFMHALGIPASSGYHHRQPLLIEENDYTNLLFNGETCIVDISNPDSPLVHTEDGRTLPLGSLPAHRAAWALTVHKSQGSEFDQVLFFLPPADSPLCARELAYTAITRAKEQVYVCGESLEELSQAANLPQKRQSGLGDLLHSKTDL